MPSLNNDQWTGCVLHQKVLLLGETLGHEGFSSVPH